MSIDIDLCFKAAIALLVITAPFDPVKILFFSQAITDPKRKRWNAALAVSTYTSIILAGSALIGQEFLELMDINLHAFSAVGGLVIALMGFEMLYGGAASKAQGQETRARGPEEGDALLVPLTLPLIAGPGAIATTITIAAQEGGIIAALVGTGVVVLVVLASYSWLGELVERATPATVAILARIGGLLLATIGAQMMLGGLKNFFA